MVQDFHPMPTARVAVAVLTDLAMEARRQPPCHGSTRTRGFFVSTGVSKQLAGSLCLLVMTLSQWIATGPRPPLHEALSLRRTPKIRTSVFGMDDRTELDSNIRPWSAVGRIDLLGRGMHPSTYRGNVAFCTGSLVARDLVVTNAHCVLDPKTNALTKQVIWFRPGFRQGELKPLATRVEQVWLGSMHPDSQRSQDWAILRLEQPLGDQVGWFSVRPLPRVGENILPRPATFVGYAMDYKNGNYPITHVGCAIASWEQREPYLHHDCDMNAGSSGGPLLSLDEASRPVIIAINAAHMSPDKVSYVEQFSATQANIAVPANYFIGMIEQLKNETPLAAFQPFYGVDVNHQPSSLWPSSYPTALLN